MDITNISLSCFRSLSSEQFTQWQNMFIHILSIISHLAYKKAKFTQNISHAYNSHFFFPALHSAPSFSHIPLSVTELITKVIRD